MKFRVIRENEEIVVIDKPEGVQVHPPESGERISFRKNALARVRTQLDGQYVFPIHRLDAATSGVLIFGKTSEVAAKYQNLFQNHKIRKFYLAVCRGVISEPGLWDSPIDEKKALTRFSPLAIKRVNERYLTLLLLEPMTGRFHQIRRHCARANHPILGDTSHGDRKFDRSVASDFYDLKLHLKCWKLYVPKFGDASEEMDVLTSRFSRKWHQVFDFFEVCPWNI